MSPTIPPTDNRRCTCGNLLEKYGMGHRMTCWSCRHTPEQLRKKNRNQGQRRIYTLKARFQFAQSAARRRGLDFSLTPEMFAILTEAPCIYGGGEVPVKLGSGIDRKNNSLGYVDGNVVPCCPKHNRIKGAWLDHGDMVLFLEKHPDLKPCGDLLSILQ